MNAYGVEFAPLLPWAAIAALAAVALAVIGFGLLRRAAGSWLRLAATTLLVLALTNPSIVSEQREPLRDVALVLVDETPSQRIANRDEETRRFAAEVIEALGQYAETLDVRVHRIRHESIADAADGTTVMRPLKSALADVPPRRVAGAILITDGQVHDVPEEPGPDAFPAPVHALITGSPDESDRRITVVESPSYGLVGEDVSLRIRVDDDATAGEPARVTIRVDGRYIRPINAVVGRETEIRIPIRRRGPTVVELEVQEGPDEITLVNNRAVVSINGVRDRLRVLLVSGEPHPGERTWRNLLKSDPSVDLVHFTILRPPEKQDGTPIHELSLIAFPTRELFEIKLGQFDLIVFDRFRRRGVLPSLYLHNIVEYVEAGGAYLEAVGPSFASPYSLYRTPLGALLPGEPTGDVLESGFRPQITGLGLRHPVTAGLPGGPETSADGSPRWGRWFRQVDVDVQQGQTLMTGQDDRPLLILDRVGDGRVAQFLSDHIWLWARGYEGGGPQAEMLRRLSHWLMKEPDLEEEDLKATLQDGHLVVTRRSVEDREYSVEITDPEGDVASHTLADQGDGRHIAHIPVQTAGLYRVEDGDNTVMSAVGDLNPLEYSDVLATADRLEPLAAATGGAVTWARDGLPAIRQVKPGRPTAGRGWIGLRENGDFVVTGLSSIPLLPAGLVMGALLLLLAATWRREAD